MDASIREPVITVLLFMFYRLVTTPGCIEKLREEIRTLTSYSDTIQLQALPYLNALIYETLRLHPSIPSGGLRITPPRGLDIDGTFIPGGTTVVTPQYSIQRRMWFYLHEVLEHLLITCANCRRRLFRSRQRLHSRTMDHQT
jgi:cytochrome P450